MLYSFSLLVVSREMERLIFVEGGLRIIFFMFYNFSSLNVIFSQKKRNDVLNRPILTRSRAHEIVRQMLESLGDSYTRFLTPAEVMIILCMHEAFLAFFQITY